MNQKELTKTFMMISRCKKPLVAIFFYKLIQRFNPYSTGTGFSRQNLTTRVGPGTVRVKIFIMAVDP